VDDPARWLPAVRAICAQHGLSVRSIQHLPQATNVVFGVDDVILKLYPPHWARLASVERAVAERLRGRLPVETPAVHAAGTLENWSYLVLGRLGGRSLHDVWQGMDDLEQRHIAAQLGEVLAELHRVPTVGLAELEADWPALVDERVRGCVERHREQGAAKAWLDQMPAFLASAAPLYPRDFRPVIVSGDVHDYHLLVSEHYGRWQLTGLVDFDDARLGFEEYDLAAPGLFIMAGRPALLSTFLQAYGYAPSVLDQQLSRRLLAYTLLHRYRKLTWWLEEFVPGAPTTLEALADTIYPFT
jgi:hygromycin-B 7''-O-kinase